MQMTAAVINAGLGDLSLGLEMAGIKVVAAYETDKGMAVIHRNNFDAPVFPLPLKIDEVKTIPRVDILAGRLYQQPRTHPKFIAREASTTGISGFLTLLDDQRPRAFFLTFRSAFLKEEPMQSFLSSAVERGYRCAYRIFWHGLRCCEAYRQFQHHEGNWITCYRAYRRYSGSQVGGMCI